jgi:hypothetical protein
MRLHGLRFSTLLVALAILSVAVPLVFGAYRILSFDWVDDAYALWGAGELVAD